MGHFKKFTLFIAVAFVLAALPGPAQADLITFNFSGHVTAVDNRDGLFNDSVTVGTLFSGQYIFNSAALNVSVDPAVASYQHLSPTGVGMSGSVGDYNFQSVSSYDQRFYIVVGNNYGSSDLYSVRSEVNEPTGNLTDYQVRIDLTDYSQTALSSVALPLTPPELSAWTLKDFFLSDSMNTNVITGQLDTLTMGGSPVPVPGTLVLLLSGLAGLGLYRRLRP